MGRSLVLAAALADGWWIWGIFLVVAFFALAYAYFTEAGSGIRYRAWTGASCSSGSSAATCMPTA